jgi:hypothetical protein
MQATMNEIDQTIFQAVSKWVGMEPGDLLRLAGLGLADALTGLYAAMSKSPEIRSQVRELVLMRQAGHLNDIELMTELNELAGMSKDNTWTPEVDG